MKRPWSRLMLQSWLLCALASVLGCGSETASTSSPRCRRYATAVDVDGYIRTYWFDASSNTYGWGSRECARSGRRYDSLYDFIEEASVPNRSRLSEDFIFNHCGMLNSSGSTSRTYHYDDLNRLVRIEGTSRWGYSAAPTLEVTEYSAWDGRGRPVSGTLWRGADQIEISITYDDADRSMTISHGNGWETYVQQDANGNTIREGSTSYTVVESEEICL